MLDHVLGRPSASSRRSQIALVLAFWAAVLFRSDARGPAVLWIRRVNRMLQRRFTPWQIVCATLTLVFALRHVADLIGLSAPEPLARLYSRSYYRATWVATAFDVGLATAMPIRPKWVRDLAGFLFAGYYMLYANEADEKLRKFRSTATVEMLRTTWEKPLNPYVRLITRPFRPSLPIVKTLLVPRPPGPRAHLPPISLLLLFDGTPAELEKATELVLDFPGGGFICMGPGCHEERLRFWARRFGRDGEGKGGGGKKVVVSVDYGKSPEYPYPWAIEECFDLYVAIVRSNGVVLGLCPAEGEKVELVLTGDSAGANIVCTVLFHLLESPLGKGVRLPKAVVLAYAALDFNFTSWMSRENLRVLHEETGVQRRTTSGADLSALSEAKDHLAHRSPLAVVHDLPPDNKRLQRTRSWTQALGFTAPLTSSPSATTTAAAAAAGTHIEQPPSPSSPLASLRRPIGPQHAKSVGPRWGTGLTYGDEQEEEDDIVDRPPGGVPIPAELAQGGNGGRGGEDADERADEQKALRERVRTPRPLAPLANPFDGPLSARAGSTGEGSEQEDGEERFGTRLTMTSRSGYFQDRIITPSMMRAMAILYIGPSSNPDLHSDYYISPLLAPARLLAQFPPALLLCGEKDPFVDDTVVLAGRVREARKEAGVEEEGEAGEWVRMEIMEGWGHGYLQMVALMPEIKGVLEDMADYIDAAFAGALFPGSTASASPAVELVRPSPPASARRSLLSRIFGRSNDHADEPQQQEMPTPVTPPPSVVATPSAPSPAPGNNVPSFTATLIPPTTGQEDDGEVLAFTPKRLRSPPLASHARPSSALTPSSATVTVPRHGILKKPPPGVIALPPPFSPQDFSRASRNPTPGSATLDKALHAQPTAKTLPSLLAAALTRSLTPPSSALASTGMGTPAVHSTSLLGTPAIGPGGRAGSKRKDGAALDEKELMRRRRMDAVFGMDLPHAQGQGQGSNGSPGEESGGAGARGGKGEDMMKESDTTLEEEMEEFLL